MLNNIGVIITRPVHQATPFYRLLEKYQAQPILFPVLEIIDPAETVQLRETLADIDKCNLAVFISPNAVERARDWIKNAGGLPRNSKIAALGSGTARALAHFGQNSDILPEGDNFDSEGLLACRELHDVRGQQIIIFRGHGGRELLGEELTRRGARVRYAEVYQRVPASPDPKELFERIIRNEAHVALITSSEGLGHFWNLIGAFGQKWLATAAHLIVFSERTAALGKNLGIHSPIHIARPATDQKIIEILIREFPKNK